MDRSASVALPVALLLSARAYIGYLFTGRRCIAFYAALGLLTIVALLQPDSAMQQGNLMDDSAAELSGGGGGVLRASQLLQVMQIPWTGCTATCVVSGRLQGSCP